MKTEMEKLRQFAGEIENFLRGMTDEFCNFCPNTLPELHYRDEIYSKLAKLEEEAELLLMAMENSPECRCSDHLSEWEEVVENDEICTDYLMS